MTKFTADSRDTTPGIFFWLRPCIDVTVLITSTSPSKPRSFPFLFPSIPHSLSLSCFLYHFSFLFPPISSLPFLFRISSPPILLPSYFTFHHAPILPSCPHFHPPPTT